MLYPPPPSGAGGLQISVRLKSFNVQKWKSPLAPLLGETAVCAHLLLSGMAPKISTFVIF